MDDLVNAHNNFEDDIDDLMAEEEKKRMQRRAMNHPSDPKLKKQMKLKGMDQGLHTNEQPD